MEPKPFLKWVGGKRQLIPELMEIVPEFNTYFEPFLGGGALFWHLWTSDMITKAHLSDINKELVTTYNVVKKQHNGLLELLRVHAERHDESHFYAVREIDWETECSEVETAARMVYLNRTCFNGLYRVNKSGGFNVPFGKYANPKIVDEANLAACAKALKAATIRHENFDEVIARAEEGDLVYFDPPYVPVSETSNFVGFTSLGFDMNDQEHLATVVDELADRGVRVIMSNSDCDWVRDRFDGFDMVRVQAKRNVNSKGHKRGKIGELIIHANCV